jgi:hypothetical protein
MNRVAIALALIPMFACAIDITTLSGKTYSNATVSRVESGNLIVMTKSAIIKIPIDQLPADVRAKYGIEFKPQKKEAGLTVVIHGKVLQVTEDGLIVKGVSLPADDQAAARRRAGAITGYKGSFQGRDGRYYDSGQTVYVFSEKGDYVDGSDFNMMCTPSGTRTYENVTGSASTVKAFKAIAKK